MEQEIATLAAAQEQILVESEEQDSPVYEDPLQQ